MHGSDSGCSVAVEQRLPGTKAGSFAQPRRDWAQAVSAVRRVILSSRCLLSTVPRLRPQRNRLRHLRLRSLANPDSGKRQHTFVSLLQPTGSRGRRGGVRGPSVRIWGARARVQSGRAGPRLAPESNPPQKRPLPPKRGRTSCRRTLRKVVNHQQGGPAQSRPEASHRPAPYGIDRAACVFPIVPRDPPG